MPDLILRHAHLLNTAGLVDVAITDGRIEAMTPARASQATHQLDIAGAHQLDIAGAHQLNLAGALLLPGFVDPHVHLDKAFLWDHPAVHGTTRAACSAALRALKRTATSDEIHARMRRALALATRTGTTTLRAQIEVDEMVGLRGLEAALRLRAECAAWLDLQIVAFPQEGLLSRPGVADLFRQAAGMGIQALGGAPAFDAADPRHLPFVFDLATQHDLDVDLHVDLSTPPDRPLPDWELAQVAELIRTHGWQRRVSVAHLQTLGRMAEPRPLLDLLCEHAIDVVTVPAAELYLARHWRDAPATDPRTVLTNVEALLGAGIRVSLATGHVHDPLNPYGNADLLSDAFLLAASLALGEPILGTTPLIELLLPRPSDITPGRIADLVVLPTPDAARAIRHHPRPDFVLKAGNVVAPASAVSG